MISLDNLTVSYGGWTLFDNISFLINPKDRIGLVGKNGAGKTTLLRIITGEQQPTSGAVTLNGDCTIGYLPQTMRVADTTTLAEETAKAFEEVLRLEAEIEALTREIAERTDYESPEYEQLLHRLNDAQDHYHILGGETRDADIEKTLLGLGFKRSDFGRATSEFSGGWRMRIELAKLLLRRPSIFLLDEPTNHLDIESIQWLEEYLRSCSFRTTAPFWTTSPTARSNCRWARSPITRSPIRNTSSCAPSAGRSRWRPTRTSSG